MTEKLTQPPPPDTDCTTAGIESPCHSKKIPLWLVLQDNVPTIIQFILGAAIIYQLTATGSMIFLFYAVFSVIWFWARICRYCHHYNTHACPCGYGMISVKIFKKQDSKSVKKVFRRNIGIVFPNLFVPFVIAIYLLLTRYTARALILTIAFSIIGFVIIPLISKLVGCRNCKMHSKEQFRISGGTISTRIKCMNSRSFSIG